MLENLTLWLGQFHFLRPLWLLALIPAALLVLAFWFRQSRAGQWQEWIAPHLLNYLIEGGNGRRNRVPLLGILVLWLLAVLALAGPAWQKLPEPVQKSGSALVVIWDMSPSMMAQDLTPSRLLRSRLKLTDLLRSRREGVTGLVAYAGEAYVVTPLTDDTATIISLLPALTPANMPMAGSNPEMALRMAYDLLQDAGIASGHVLLLTDDIVPDAFDSLARIKRSGDHQLTIWGLGTAEGAPIPLPSGGFARDNSGNVVIARLNEDVLQKFAADIEAYYVPFLQNDEDIETLERLFTTRSDNLRGTDRVFDNWYEHGPWLLIIVLPFVALTFRRGWLMCLALFALPLSLPQPVHAASWQDLWQTRNQQAQQALTQQQPEKAAELFEDPSWRGIAHYRAGDFGAALEAFKQGKTPRDLYNQGNSLMQLGDYSAAIKSYDAVLEQNPQHEDARANKALAEQLLQQQKQQEQQEQQQDNDGQQQQGDENQQQQGDQNEGSQSQQDGNPESSQNSDGNQQGSDASENGGDPSQQPYDDPGNNELDSEDPADTDETDAQDQQGAVAEQANNEQQSEKDAEAQRAQAGDSSTDEQDPNGKKNQAVSTQMSEAEREQQQALEQWLRKVPDDPSGLMRNKLQYEHHQRRRSGQWQAPENKPGQRW